MADGNAQRSAVFSPVPFLRERPPTDWTALSDDPIRLAEEVPWLQYEVDEAVEKALHEEAPGREYWLGYRDALLKAIHHPLLQVQEAKQAEAQAREARRKAIADGGRIVAGTTILRRTDPGFYLRDPAGRGR